MSNPFGISLPVDFSVSVNEVKMDLSLEWITWTLNIHAVSDSVAPHH